MTTQTSFTWNAYEVEIPVSEPNWDDGEFCNKVIAKCKNFKNPFVSIKLHKGGPDFTIKITPKGNWGLNKRVKILLNNMPKKQIEKFANACGVKLMDNFEVKGKIYGDYSTM